MKSPEETDVERRLLVAILLSMAILFATPYVYQLFFPAPDPPPAVVMETEPRTPQEEGPAREGPDPLAELAGAELEVPVEGQVETLAVPRELRQENADVVLILDSRGAVIRSVRLKGYLDDHGDPLELVPQGLPPEFDRMLDVRTGNEVLDSRLREAVYEAESGPVAAVGGAVETTFTYRRGGLEVVKKVALPRNGFALQVSVEVRSDGQAIPVGLSLGTGLGQEPGGTTGDFALGRLAFRLADGVHDYDPGDLEAGVVQLEGSPTWIAVDSKYFAAAAVAPGQIRSVRLERREWVRDLGGSKPETIPLVSGSAGLQTGTTLVLFLGPKNSGVLEAVEGSLSELIDYGWFGLLVIPLLAGLKGIYGFVGNYGWAIILLTFGINLALFPVRYKQIVSMQKMSALQPKLRSIQDRYKRMKREDPRRQQMNTEVMALYKEHGVNPLGGCLPLLLQMPILFAFYRMLDSSIELRGAPFMLWITDLSKHDPYFVTPIVMGITMVAQQKMTPATGDPTQRKMMMFLPVVFTFFFLWVSSGLAIYFLFSNVFAMAFQVALQKLKPETMPGVGGAAKKAKA
jgi:YidC/Oxa1 family membrane protein insertase